LPIRNKALTKEYYLNKLRIKELNDYCNYLTLGKDNIEIHFFELLRQESHIKYITLKLELNKVHLATIC
jgi:hypothetical protein